MRTTHLIVIVFFAQFTSACAVQPKALRSNPDSSFTGKASVDLHEPPHGEEADLRQLKVEQRSDGDEKSDHGDNLNSVNVAGETSQKNPKPSNIDTNSGISDPWEGFNRKTHAINSVLDKYIVRPVGVAYDAVTPDPVQHSVTRFFGNLRGPSTVVNQLLQGKPFKAGQSVSRFVVNTTVGIGGLFDPASSLGLSREDADLGQTFASWGWRDSRYIVLPLLGPTTLRDATSMFGEQKLSPTSYVSDTALKTGLQFIQITNNRARLLARDELRKQSLDDYIFVRDAWTKRRNHQLSKD